MNQSAHQAAGARLTLQNLTKLYGEVVAVDHCNLEIEAGEFLTLLGPSGSGKTTTLMMIAGFVIPTTGDILVNDRSIVTVPPSKRNLGMVFQQYSLFPHMNVFDNIAFPLQMRHVPKAEITQRVKAALELVRLPGLEQRRPNQLSGGQQQRVALARALVFEPSALLLDEPLGALDRKLREELQLEIKHLHEELGVTIVYVTHDQGEALTMSDRIAVLNNGAIEQVGMPDELYRRPANWFVAEFLGESNFFTGPVVEMQRETCTVKTEDGLQIAGALRDSSVNPEKATVMVRPESIIPVGEPEGLSMTFEGKVEEVIYLGEVTRYRIRLGSSTVVIATWQNRAGVQLLKPGNTTRVGWHVEDTIVISDVANASYDSGSIQRIS